ncbi:ATP-dependent exoDNAse (exonuclease V) beta subunit (contains helicase and exonuclease domains) [Thermoactinomyces sp. DSM 45891]|uniref:UvrD-helicase domain-containing protein n=1 Tax=Thermoactinomyces sp. DSM 45891 TaxID=1761907 RepID=UPI000923FF5F|nr:UvrD-helicase domain-containing protein [Thermoactinomyces sp. DSM 45891]SFX45926.1 ATP-dependent exoDNAse (exonuclease V) beta subunit (contains helicase and exonuclease domains) [Thermoactinomyces sp. DSM 45891]
METWIEELICESLSEEQKEAVLSKQDRCVVMAGAGAGKTRVLVKRFVYTLYQFGMNPSNLRKIVAITFTKKAATEMRDRLRKEMDRIIERLGKKEDDEEVQSWNEVRQCLDEAHIYTIHSFCQLILSAEPVQAGVDPFFQVLEEWEANRLLEQAVVHVLSSSDLLHQRSTIEREWWIYYLSLMGWTRAEAMLVELSRKWRNQGWAFSKLVDCTTESLQRFNLDHSEENELSRESEEMITRILLFYLQEIHVYYQLLKKQKARYDYQDLVQMVVEALEKDTSFRMRIKKQIQSLMIDEYQDTDGLQKRLVDFIMAEPLGANRHLFVVGDPKQSIYRFRGADVSIFIKTQKEWLSQGDRNLSLTHNYRSQSGIVQFSNQLCQHAFPVDEFRLIQASRSDQDRDDPVQLISFSSKDLDNEKLVEREAILISHQIKRLRSDFQYGDMVLLLRKMNDATLYEQILRSQGLPVRIVGGSGFYETQEIQDFLYLFATVLTPAHAENWVGALRSPFAHLSDEGITRLALKTGWKGVPQSWLDQSILSENDQLRLQTFCFLYESLRRMSFRRTPGQLIRWVIEHSNYTTILWGLPNGAQAVFNLEKWCQVWEKESDPTLLTLEGFLEKMEQYQSKTNQEPEEEIWDEGEDVIRIMTIHKSKGLEFPIVFLPNLWNASPVSVSRDSSLIHPTMGLVIKGFNHLEQQSYTKTKIEFPRWKEAVFYEDELEWKELMRLLYVAVTRAEEYLFLSFPEHQGKATPKKDLASWLKRILKMEEAEPREFVLFGCDSLPILYEDTLSAPPPLVEDSRRSDTFDPSETPFTVPIPLGKYNHILISVTDWKELVHCPRKYYYHRILQVPTPDVERGEEKLAVPSISGNRRGEIVHYLCEKTVSSTERLWLQPDWFDQIVYIFRLNSREIEGLKPDLEQIRIRFLDSYVVQRIAESKKVLTEESFQYVTPGFRISGQIDLLLQDQHRGWEIIDFKTDRMKVEDIAEKRAFYLPQLQLYSLAWRARGMEINGVTLYFLDCNHEEKIKIDTKWWHHAESLLENTRSFFQLERKMFNWPTKPSKNCSYCEYNVLCDKISTNS